MTRRGKTAFTTLELLIVIGIIAVLAAMTYIGFKTIGGGGKIRATRGTLESCRALLAELSATSGGIDRIKSLYGTSGAGYDLYLPAVGDVSETNPTRDNLIDLAPDANHPRQRDVMTVLLSMPGNRAILASIPPQNLLKANTKIPPGKAGDPVMLLDAWGNPIFFVPRGGLYVTKIAEKVQNKVVTSGGVINPGDALPAGATGFFASAGPDGDFSKADDNLYSFGD